MHYKGLLRAYCTTFSFFKISRKIIGKIGFFKRSNKSYHTQKHTSWGNKKSHRIFSKLWKRRMWCYRQRTDLYNAIFLRLLIKNQKTHLLVSFLVQNRAPKEWEPNFKVRDARFFLAPKRAISNAPALFPHFFSLGIDFETIFRGFGASGLDFGAILGHFCKIFSQF